jgi:hypothetical protein
VNEREEDEEEEGENNNHSTKDTILKVQVSPLSFRKSNNLVAPFFYMLDTSLTFILYTNE